VSSLRQFPAIPHSVIPTEAAAPFAVA